MNTNVRNKFNFLQKHLTGLHYMCHRVELINF